ncbi:MAG TPA: anaerobic ribonucleoside-triphosphate reductase activating protein [Candidatus Pacearchaeota archaeon]|nr:anaerobic ribonucleoside-triphosphate reductase activating protein [Candidatus Pacearchaeota archaeon]
MEICGLQKTTLIDYPGKVAAIVFLGGCNFRCGFCYSSELVLPDKLKNQPRVDEKEFFDFLESKCGLLDGVVICGGEPTLSEDLPQFMDKIKNLGFALKLDTNGTNPDLLRRILEAGLADYVAMDIKAPKEKYSLVCGRNANLQDIEKSIALIKSQAKDFEFRTTVVPGLHTAQDISDIAHWIGDKRTKYYLQNFWPAKTLDPELQKVHPFDDIFLKEICTEIKSHFLECRVRNMV